MLKLDERTIQNIASIRASRETRGWSLSRAAREIGVLKERLARFEQGTEIPSLPIYIQMSHVFGWARRYRFGD